MIINLKDLTGYYFGRIAYKFNKPFKLKKKILPLKPSTRKSTSGFSVATINRKQIRVAASLGKCVKIIYRKTTTEEVKEYILEPYSFRYRRIKVGIRKMFYGYDIEDGTIKSFAISNILKAKITDRLYSPRYEVEIKVFD